MKKIFSGDKGIEPCPIQSHSPLATYPTEIKNIESDFKSKSLTCFILSKKN